ncbi:MAG: bacillithiol biosynthesis deacetylase BshB1 [Bacteroidia bacterium]
MKLDVLVFGAHPDDAEIGCGGTIAKLVSEGKKVGIIDMTRGELGSRGSAELRDIEAQNAGKILGVEIRENLRFRDGFFVQDETHQLDIIKKVRKYQPDVILANAPSDRHPDHGRASKLVRDAVFLSGLRKIETEFKGKSQKEWRPSKLFFYIQDYSLQPDFVVDISSWVEVKTSALAAFSSQFYDPGSDEPITYISTRDFWDFLDARARNMGHIIGATHGEGFISETPLKIHSPLDLI